MDFKIIHIGSLIKKKIKEKKIDYHRICNFMDADSDDIDQMLASESLDSQILLRWCKLLEYDFFRIYSQHLILYAPPSASAANEQKRSESHLPIFRKNIYTQEIIDFILEEIRSGELTKVQAAEKYRIPKTTLYKWIHKYENSKN